MNVGDLEQEAIGLDPLHERLEVSVGVVCGGRSGWRWASWEMLAISPGRTRRMPASDD